MSVVGKLSDLVPRCPHGLWVGEECAECVKDTAIVRTTLRIPKELLLRLGKFKPHDVSVNEFMCEALTAYCEWTERALIDAEFGNMRASQKPQE